MEEAGGKCPKMPDFKWNSRSDEAALNIATGELSHLEISKRAGINDKTLRRWEAHPDFKARVDEHVAEFRARVRSRGIAIIENRVNRLQRRCELMDRVIRERGQSEEMQGVAGGTTGLLARNVKGIGRGEDFQVVEVFEVDTALLNELRQHEKQAAVELGQWEEKQTVKAEGETVVKILRGVSMDDL